MAKSTHQRRSKLQEARIASEVGGRVQAGSGSSWRSKSDVRSFGKLRLEAKHTNKNIYRLKLKDILKVRDEGLKGGLEPWAMQIEFVRSIGSSKKFAVMDYHLYVQLRLRLDDTPISVRPVSTIARQATLDCEEMLGSAGNALQAGKGWALQILFCNEQWEPLITAAVLDWDEFVALFLKESP